MLGARLAPLTNVPPERFAELRETTELELRQRINFRIEVKLEDICIQLAKHLGDIIAPEKLLQAELIEEQETIVAVPAIFSLLEAARARFKRLAFVSDTYLPQDFLRDILFRLKLLSEGDLLFCSSHYGCMKSTGELFIIVSRALGLPPNRIQHFGDNEESDIAQAKLAGLRPTHIRDAIPNRYEQFAVSHDNILERSQWLGLSRLTRLAAPDAASPTERVIWETSANVSAPLITVFVNWCLREARRRDVKRLYFLARDGHVMLQVAKVLLGTEVDIDCRYLYVSRQSLLLPAISEDIEKELDWILAPTQLLTPRIVLKRVAIELSDTQVAAALDSAGFPRSVWDVQLDADSRAELGKVLRAVPMASIIYARAKVARADAIDYLKQEGLFDGTSFAVVDVGWNGTLQRSISRLLEYAIPKRAPSVLGLYIGIRNRRLNKPNDEMKACFFDTEKSCRIEDINGAVPLIELFCAAPHAGTSHYREVDGRWSPQLRSHSPSAAWPIGVQQTAILTFARLVAESALTNISLCTFKDLTINNLAHFAENPVRDEARAYGSYLDAEDQNEAYQYPLAMPYSFWTALRVRRGAHGHHQNEWRAACLAITPRLVRRLAAPAFVERKGKTDAVVSPSIVLVRGFGPLEGPYADPKLPRFRWIYGPSAEISLPEFKAGNLNFIVTTLFDGQRMRIVADGTIIANLEIPPLTKTKDNSVLEVVDLGALQEVEKLILEFDTWQTNSERPLAAILVGLYLS